MSAAGGHLSAAEIAELKLPGLPHSKKGILLRADAERWPSIERRGRGGGRLYSIAHLPEQAQAALQLRTEKLVPANLRPVGRPQGSDYFTQNPSVADAVEALIAEQPRSAMRVLELLSRSFRVLPSRRTLSRFIAKLEEEKAALLASTRNPDLFNSRYRISLGRADGAVTHANQVWELDTTPVDVQLIGGRKAILGVIDRYSRRARFLVADSESGQSVRRLLIDTIRAWGAMPETVMTDNGSGYINGSIVSALETLGIEHFRCPPGSPWKKPFIERLFGTFTRERATLLPGFSGHNVAQAQALRSREKKRTGKAEIVASMQPHELQAVLDAWVDGVYHQREHQGMRATPLDRWRQSSGRSAKAPSEDILRIALSALVGARKVGKRGIEWKRGRYWAPALAAWAGRMVTVRRDEDDLGALYIFDENGHFIDTAIDHERAGMSEQQFAMAARRQQAQWIAQGRAEIRQKQRAFSFEDARDQLLRDDAEAAGKLAILPSRTEARSTPQLDSIAIAPAPAVPSQARLDDAMRRTAPRRPVEPTIAEKVAATDLVLAALQAGEDVDPTELARAQLFASTTAYRAQKALMAPFQTPIITPAARRHTA